MRILLTVFILFLGMHRSQAQEVTAITGATLIHTHIEATIADGVLLIEGDRIIAAGARDDIAIPPGAKRIDASGKFVVPGMIEGHMHFFQSGGLYTRPDGLDLRHRKPYEDELAWIRANLDDVFSRYLACGITTVVDAGGPMWNFDIRQRAQSTDRAPRVLVAGPLIASYQPDALTTDDPPIIRVQTVEEALSLLREQAAKDVDVIKIWYVGAPASTLSRDEFDAIVSAVVSESQKHGLPVWVHATELELARASVNAGADVLVHSVTDAAVDDAFVALLKEKDVSLIPTLRVFESYGEVYGKKLQLLQEEQLLANPFVISTLYDMYELDDEELTTRVRALQQRDERPAVSDLVLENLRTLHEAGIRIAAGSDAGNVGMLHGPGLYRDFQLMRTAGMSNRDILLSATLQGARMIGKEDELGSLEAGKLADLVILDADPLEDIMNAARVHRVFLRGASHTRHELLPPTPTALAQIQLNAYNARDIETFLTVYSDSVEVYSWPNTLLYRGKERMREIYTAFFAEATALHCRLVDRLAYDNVVIDSEDVSGVPGRSQIRAVAVYEIEHGRIARVRFLQ